MNEYLIAIGSNLGDRKAHIENAVKEIEARCGRITARSFLYETAPIGAADQTFLNGALTIASVDSPEGLLKKLLEIELSLGRTREVHWGNRTIDLDILLGRDQGHAALVMVTGTLIIPHPRMLDRDFVLVPATDIAGDWLHPVSGKKLREEVTMRFPEGLRASSTHEWRSKN